MAPQTRRGVIAGTIFVALVALGIPISMLTRPTSDALCQGTPRVTDPTLTWTAVVLLVLAASWVAIGMVAARTRLVARPGAGAARASWISSTRPWRARESVLGMLSFDRWLMTIIPLGLLVATLILQAALLPKTLVAIELATWVILMAVLLWWTRDRSPWPVVSTLAGVTVLRCIVTLVGLVATASGGNWCPLWTNPTLHSFYVPVSFALVVWAFIASAWALRTKSD